MQFPTISFKRSVIIFKFSVNILRKKSFLKFSALRKYEKGSSIQAFYHKKPYKGFLMKKVYWDTCRDTQQPLETIFKKLFFKSVRTRTNGYQLLIDILRKFNSQIKAARISYRMVN